MLPQMLAEPRRAHRPQPAARAVARSGEAPDVGDVVRDEAARVVMQPRRAPPRRPQTFEQVEERQMQFREVGHFGGPVIHLQVYVEVIVAVPRRPESVGPDALQIGWQIAWSAARDEQVAAELEILGDELIVFAALLHTFEPLVCGQIARSAELKLDAIEERLI